MDQKKIGAFIAQCRKEKSLTQIQLAELLDITNQAVSKWENGRGMPDVSLLQPLCDALGISLNELFSGEHISAEEYKGKAEENISKLYKEKQIANLKPIKYLFSTCSNVTLLVAVIELAVGFIGNFFNPTILKVMLLNASVWIMLFLISVGKLTYDKKRLKNLKHSGTCIDSEIKDIIPASWITVGNYICCRIVCGFICNGVQREHNKKLNNGLPILHKVPPKRDYGRYFCIMAKKGGTSHGGLTEKLSPFFHA